LVSSKLSKVYKTVFILKLELFSWAVATHKRGEQLGCYSTKVGHLFYSHTKSGIFLRKNFKQVW
jgi:hypothetical protein